jgi:hypothetical protein
MRRDGVVVRVVGGLVLVTLAAEAREVLGHVRQVAACSIAVDGIPALEHAHEREPHGESVRVRRAISSTSSDLFYAFTVSS